MKLPTLASRTEEVLRRHRIGIPEAADQVGVDPATIWKMTRGRSVSPETLTRFAQTFGEDPAEWIALGRPELAGAIEEIRRGVPVREVPPRGLPTAPRAGVVKRFGVVEWDSGEIRDAWGTEMGEFIVETTTLAPVLLRGDHLVVEPATTAARGDMVIARSGDVQGKEEVDILVRFVATTEEGLRVCDLSDEALAEPFELPHSRVIGVVEFRVTDLRRPKRRRKR